ncbi:FMN-dependent NADH-azoreductase [Frigidibacter sp.]|uniref:FMN-dependent NADH-azoreductase n=1 Tax=Frigidibacter sp. TaxID=2586418 RepID=UPI002732C966|nr:NAD(P)H-dependent oxidoreductase [Frigidibacter sp.]MDP3340699.1 NAD(P)H-dependent oxidoreductase [Frigidibacter sp.]
MKLLHINASPRGEDSQSLALAGHFISELARGRSVEVDRLDLFQDDLPAFGPLATGAKMALFSGRAQTEAETAAWAAIRTVFDRFAAADIHVFNVPVWNNGIPYVLKQFIDLVTQPGWSFGFDPGTGYTGLMTGRKAVVIHASGVWHEGIGANFGSDFSTPYLQDWLTFIGITDVEHLRIQPTVLNADFAATRAEAWQTATRLAEAA